MKPILYEKDEMLFSSNGLGRLQSCISAKVSEEKNGIFECDFEYPVSAIDFDLVKVGRILGVTHDDTGDIQPFDIVSVTRPINGIVSFHCTHISYRQSYLTVRGSNINSLADALSLLTTATPSNPFTYSTNKTSTGYMAAADKIPKSVRQMLGGVEGSILDTYGGEFEWDKFDVILHESRGIDRDFTIRYGVNMIDYEEEYSIQGTYSSCVPYWTDGNKIVVGSRQDSGNATITGRGECIPLDVSDKFESKPTKAQVEAMGLSMLSGKQLPAQTINVEFIRLQDMPEYAGYGALMQCSLCDTIEVIFPSGANGRFKIVKTVWDVLKDRYESMELGELSATLSEALGITEFGQYESGYEEITGVDKISISANSSEDITIDSGEKALLIGAGSSSAKLLAVVNCTSAGAVTNLKVAGGSDITLTNGTNKITVVNGYGANIRMLIIRF